MSNADRIEELRSKYEENPRRYFAPLANEFRKAGDLAQAIAICREHLPKQPGHMSGFIVFGQTLFEANSLDEARTVFEQALALDPENLIALKHLGDIARMRGENSVARRWYERVLDADPRNDDIAAQLAALASPTPVIAMEAVPAPDAGTREPTSNDALGVFATYDPAALLDVPEDVVAPERVRSEWEPRASLTPRMVQRHEPIDLDFPDDPEPASDAELAGEFEEGLLAPEWPDTSDLVARVTTPVRSATPLDVPVTFDAMAAFGREDRDPGTADSGPLADLPLSDEFVDAYVPPANDAHEAMANVGDAQAFESEPETDLEITAEYAVPSSITMESETETPTPPFGAHIWASTEVIDEAAIELEAPFELPEFIATQSAAESAPLEFATELEELVGAANVNSDVGESVLFEDVHAAEPVAAAAEFEMPAEPVARAFEEESFAGVRADLNAEVSSYDEHSFADIAAEVAAEGAAEVAADAVTSVPEASAVTSVQEASPLISVPEASAVTSEPEVSFDNESEQDAAAFGFGDTVDADEDDVAHDFSSAFVSTNDVAANFDDTATYAAAFASIEPDSNETIEVVADVSPEIAVTVSPDGVAHVAVDVVDNEAADFMSAYSLHGMAETVESLPEVEDSQQPDAEVDDFMQTEAEVDTVPEAEDNTRWAAETHGVPDEEADAFDDLAFLRGTPENLSTVEHSFADVTMDELVHADVESDQGEVEQLVAAATAENVHEEEVVTAQVEVAAAEPVAPAAEASPVEEAAPAFVTETMAELLVSQGFTARAVTIYEELVRRRPFDPVLTSRLAELREQSTKVDAPPTPAPTTHSPTPVASSFNVHSHTPRYSTPLRNTPLYVTPMSAASMSSTPHSEFVAAKASHADAAPVRTARDHFSELAQRRVPRRTPTHATVVAEDPADGLSSLFGSALPTTPDELAARALADAFGPVQDSGESLFDAPQPASAMPLRAFTPRSIASQPAPAAAMSVSSHADRQSQNTDYSFDRFFPDPAMAARNASATSAPSSVPDASQPPNEDLAQFSAWLKGLNNA